MVQRTFTIVPPPGPAVTTPADNRPMTSRQVRKAYRAANRVPRVSRAELLRQERAEQERIRKELEKEKATAKAKAAREKKKAKELVEKEEKRKKGLPLVTVRPSQDTIARFVRGNSSGTKRDCTGQDVKVADAPKNPILPVVEEESEEEGEHEEIAPSPKRLCSRGQRAEEDKEHKDALLELETKIGTTSENEIPHSSNREEDLLEDFEVMSDEEISKLSTEEKAAKIGEEHKHQEPLELKSAKDPEFEDAEQPLCCETISHGSSPIITIKNPKQITRQELDLLSDDDDLELGMLELEALMTTQQRLDKAFREDSSPRDQSQKSTRRATTYEIDLGLDASRTREDSDVMAPTKGGQASLMPPPPVPVQRSSPWPIVEQAQIPPLSTQQILFNMDDFFPTSSQQAVELEEEATISISQTESKLVLKSPAQSPNSRPKTPSASQSSSPEQPKPFFTSSGTNERIAVALLHSRRTAEREARQRQQALQLEAVQLENAKRQEAEAGVREKKLAENSQMAKTVSAAATRKRQAPQQNILTASPPTLSTTKGLLPATMNSCNAGKAPVLKQPQNTNPDATTPLMSGTKSAVSLGMYAKSPSTSSRVLSPKQTDRQQPRELQRAPSHTKTPTKVSNKENASSTDLIGAQCPLASQESEFGGSWVDELATEFMI